ncbi:unnamed protein product [Anisakis simplex]|uniref:Uncharacterized protein n=1 Tax=Anisakis simplex TaxID=6269 RepID=A0A0M3JLX4_ANISI|nr:unnamed protein product [Anisakis simplex]
MFPATTTKGAPRTTVARVTPHPKPTVAVAPSSNTTRQPRVANRATANTSNDKSRVSCSNYAAA